MKKLSLIIASLLMLTACGSGHKQANFPDLPDELKDCKIYDIWRDATYITIARCPNSITSTTYRSGKTTKKSVVIDGVIYEKKESP